MSKGIVLFGINNGKIDYIKLAIIAAKFAKKNMPGIPIALITDSTSLDWHSGEHKLSAYFDSIIEIPKTFSTKFTNNRKYRDTQYYDIIAPFKNESRSLVYDLSPFDETLLIDSDYLIMSDHLSTVWGSVEEFMINNTAIGLDHRQLEGPEFRLNPFGIRMYWATVIYFRKSEKAAMMFHLVEHIRENWDFYKLTYDFPNTMFRNDYAFSIAIHILNGFSVDGDFVTDLPDPSILTATDHDQCFRINALDDASFFYNDKKEPWRYYVSRIKGLNVHCMNKFSLLNNFDTIMELA